MLLKNIKYKTAIFFIVAVFVIVFDRLFKSGALVGYFDNKISIFGDLIFLVFESNVNIAFSLPLEGVFLNIVIILILVSLIAHAAYLFNMSKIDASFLVGVIVLGAASNLFDRLKYGFVVDYIYVKYFAIFNLADALIFFGVVMFFLFERKVHN